MDGELLNIKQRYGIVGDCEALNSALEVALRVAPTDLSVLVLGENGSGKDVLSRVIHDNSRRSRGPYMAINCGAIAEGTIDSELFGHVKGAYTGAAEDRKGYFSAANGGTLFLDEVGELPLATQARLLRVLETGEYIPVGSDVVCHTDVRIVAATNVDMSEAIRRGKFREDLYYRLNAVTVRIPALRDRGQDIVRLFRLFAVEMCEKYGMPKVTLTPEAAQVLCDYHWPGNVRQLRNVVENLSILSDERSITPEILKPYLPAEAVGRGVAVAGERQNGDIAYADEREVIFKMLINLRQEVDALKAQLNGSAHYTHKHDNMPAALPMDSASIQEVQTSDIATVDESERELIRRALERTNGKRAAAAREIGMAERTFYRKIKEYGL